MEIHNEFSAAKRKCLIISAMKNKVGLNWKLKRNKLYYLFRGGGGEELNTNQHSYKPSKYKPAHHSFPCNYVAEEVEWILVHNWHHITFSLYRWLPDPRSSLFSQLEKSRRCHVRGVSSCEDSGTSLVLFGIDLDSFNQISQFLRRTRSFAILISSTCKKEDLHHSWAWITDRAPSQRVPCRPPRLHVPATSVKNSLF